MKIAAVLFLWSFRALAAGTWCQPIVIQHSQVPDSDQANYVLTINDTDPHLATVANGGFVRNSDGSDIVFASDSQGQQLLHWDPLELYNPATGQIVTHVQAGTVSHTVDTTIFRCAGGTASPNFQGGPVGSAWPDYYKAVYHLGNSAGLSAADATVNANNGTINGATATAGQTGGGANFSGDGQFLNLGSGASFRTAAPLTVEFWVRPAVNSDSAIVSSRDGTNGYGWGMHITNGHWTFVKYGNLEIDSSVSAAVGNWTHVAWVVGNDNRPLLYINGVLAFSSSDTSAIRNSILGSAAIGGVELSTAPMFGVFLNGSTDEVRIIAGVLSSDRIATDYANQSNPAAFYETGVWSSTTSAESQQVVF